MNIENKKKIQKDFIKNGYCIFKIKNKENLNYIRNKIENLTKIKNLNSFHQNFDKSKLNHKRLNIFKSLNKDQKLRKYYYNIFKDALSDIVGNELMMQKKINLNIQIPHDQNSLIDMHADSYSGESNFEVISWLPLVNVYSTKSMYVLPLRQSMKIEKEIAKYNNKGTDSIFEKYKKNIKFLKLNFGEGLIFSSNILHGNKVNLTEQTRFSFNCRFKSVFTPQNFNFTNKTNSNMYSNVSLKPASALGMEYIQDI